MLETLTSCTMTWNFPESSKHYKVLWPKIEKGKVVLVKLKTQHLCTIWELDCEEGWAPKNWCVWTVELEKTLESLLPWTARSSNQSILKEIHPEYSFEALMLKLKLQYFGHLLYRTDSFENTPMLGKIEGGSRRDDRGWDGWMASPTWWTWVWASSGSWWWTGKPGVLQSMGSQRVGHDWATELNTPYGQCYLVTSSGSGLLSLSSILCVTHKTTQYYTQKWKTSVTN